MEDHNHEGHDHAEESILEPILEPAVEPQDHAGHDHSSHEGESIWQGAWEIFADPAHIIAEVGWNIIQDGIVIWLLYGIVFKKLILPKLRKDIHREIDKEHGIEH